MHGSQSRVFLITESLLFDVGGQISMTKICRRSTLPKPRKCARLLIKHILTQIGSLLATGRPETVPHRSRGCAGLLIKHILTQGAVFSAGGQSSIRPTCKRSTLHRLRGCARLLSATLWMKGLRCTRATLRSSASWHTTWMLPCRPGLTQVTVME